MNIILISGINNERGNMIEESKCDCCNDSEEHEYHYWNENICEIEEDYIMPDEFGCVCYRCFEQLKQQGRIKFKQQGEKC